MTNDAIMLEHQRIQDTALDLVFAAVEPADRAAFDAHIATCSHCGEFVDELTSMVGLIGAVGDVEAPPTSLRAAILAGVGGLSGTRGGAQAPGEPVTAGSGTDTSGDAVASSPASPFTAAGARGRRRARRSTLTAAATRLLAVAAVLAVIGLVGWGSVMHSQRDDARATASQWSQFHDAVSRPGQLTVAELDAADGSTTKRLATAYMRDTGMMVVADDLAANDTASSIYVLWSLASPTDGAPVALGTFDVAKGSLMSFVAATGSAPSGRWFAISEEPGRRVPAAPTNVLGSGEAA